MIKIEADVEKQAVFKDWIIFIKFYSQRITNNRQKPLPTWEITVFETNDISLNHMIITKPFREDEEYLFDLQNQNAPLRLYPERESERFNLLQASFRLRFEGLVQSNPTLDLNLEMSIPNNSSFAETSVFKRFMKKEGFKYDLIHNSEGSVNYWGEPRVITGDNTLNMNYEIDVPELIESPNFRDLTKVLQRISLCIREFMQKIKVFIPIEWIEN
jgi:hypothetical protein